MKCPYCEEEMSIGYIHNGNQPIQWLPSGKKPSIFRFSAVEDGVKLNSKLSLNGYCAKAYYCNTCHIVIAKTER